MYVVVSGLQCLRVQLSALYATSQQGGLAYFEESIKEGNVVCPLLKCSLEKCQSSVDAQSVLSIGFILDRHVVL